MKKALSIGAALLLIAAIAGLSYRLGYQRGQVGGNCVDPDMCVEGDEWLKQELATIGEAEANSELSKMIDECQAELSSERSKATDDLPELTKAALALSECRGALKECQRK